MSYDSAFEKTIGLEGGLSMDPEDSGNWTGGKIGVGLLKGSKYGVSAASHPNLDIANLTLDDAKGIYVSEYWGPLHCDEIPNEQVANKLFDMAVNTSAPFNPQTAVKILQRAINFLEPGEVDSPLKTDGDIGPVTLGYIKKWCSKDPEALFEAMNGEQYAYYKACEYTDPIKKKFGWGWMKRLQPYKK